jgi:subtilisin family serine protease
MARNAAVRRPRAKDIVGPVAFVLVRAPAGVPDRTTVLARGRPALQTGVASSLPLGDWNLTLVHGSRRWVGTAALDIEHPIGDPFMPEMTEVAPVAGSVPVLRAQAPDDAAFQPGEARTVVYVHGIGNKATVDVLRCQWDRALLDVQLGERSRMAYWVDRARYPVPETATCGDGDTGLPGAAGMAARAAGLAAPSDPAEALIDALTGDPGERRALRSIAQKLEGGPPGPGGPPSVKILPGGRLTRRWLARWLTDLLLPDVHDYLFDADARERMLESLADRLRAGGEPFVVVGHSLGSVIAYELLRRFRKEDCDVALFVTVGSPLGMQEIQDHLAQSGPLATPECVRRWVNFADPEDPVAIDPSLAGEFKANKAHRAEVVDIPVENTDRSRNPHSGTGYLSTKAVREVVRETTGQAFASPLVRGSLATDVTSKVELQRASTLHEVLIQVNEPFADGPPVSLAGVKDQLVVRLKELAATRPSTIPPLEEPDRMRRFVAASLTRSEIESLRTLASDLNIRLVWANAEKRALIHVSAATTQALPAQLGYAATGEGIAWAVLDTGIDETHPHFAQHRNVLAQWDCMGAGDPKELSGGHEADPNGHGTHVAGIIAGEAQGLWQGQKRRMAGMAPRTRLYGFRVLGKDGVGSDRAIIKALDTVAALNEDARSLVIHGVNLSLGSGYDPSNYNCGYTPLCQELRRLWRQGVAVCLAAGNEGYGQFQSADGEVGLNLALSIGDPANLEEAIAVGSVHKENPHSYGISYFSSRGPTADGRRKPDCVAPGERIVSARTGGRQARGSPEDLSRCYVEMSGTSMATPHVSGVLAGFFSARREFVGDPDHAKRILLANCTDLRRDPNMQGAGLVNLTRMLLGT